MKAMMLTPQKCVLFHRWKTVHDTGFTLYQECADCESRRATQPKTGGYQPINTEWVLGTATNDQLLSNEPVHRPPDGGRAMSNEMEDGWHEARLEARAGTQRSDVVPGVVHCARCHFRLVRVTLYTLNGTAGAGDSNTEPCPNGCGPLRPVTWEQECRQGYKLGDAVFERAKRAEDALRELVALKGIEDKRLRARQSRPQSLTRILPHDVLNAEADYRNRKDAAWAAARAALGPNESAQPASPGDE